MNNRPNETPETNETTETTEAVSTEATEAAKTTETADDTKPSEKSADKKAKKAKRTRNLRRLRYGSTSTAITVVVIAAVVLLNIIVGIVADRFPVTLDLSANKIYSMSDESIAVAESVKDDLQIVVFMSEDTFSNSTTGSNSGVPEFDTTMKEFYNILKQYRSHSDNQISYSFIDPDQEPTKFAAYSIYEVQAGDILFIYGNRSRTCSVSDLYTYDSSNYYSTGSYTFKSNVEKVLASNIHAVTAASDEHIVQVLVGHEEDSNVIDGLKSLYELNGYTFEENTITASQDFNAKAEVMLIAAPAKDYTDDEIKRVQQWLYNDGNYGRHLMVFTSATASCPNLYEYLQVEYKLNVTNEILLETDYARIQSYNQLYAMCDVPSTDFTPKSESTAKVFTPQARRITTSLSEKSEDNSLGSYGIQLTNYPETANVITLEDLNSQADNLNDMVYTPDSSLYPLSSMIAYVRDSYNNETQTSTRATVVVSGCPFMAYDSMISNGNYKNEELLLDTINSMTGMEDTLSISTKSISEDTVNFNNKTALWLGLGVFVIGLPIVLLIVCLVVFLRRKNL